MSFANAIHPLFAHNGSVEKDFRAVLRTVVGVLAVLCATQGSATTIYVSPRGNDAADGLGPGDGHALRTIQAGVNKLRAGDTLLVRGGIYRETVTFSRSGTKSAPIALRPYREESVTVTGCDPVAGWVLHDAAKNIC